MIERKYKIALGMNPALMGALLGGGAGVVSGVMSEEDKAKKAWKRGIIGALLGAGGGYALDRLSQGQGSDPVTETAEPNNLSDLDPEVPASDYADLYRAQRTGTRLGEGNEARARELEGQMERAGRRGRLGEGGGYPEQEAPTPAPYDGVDLPEYLEGRGIPDSV